MVKGCGTSCIKTTILLFNIVFVIAGLLLVGFGILIAVKGVTIFADTEYISMPFILIIIGCSISVLGIFGCCGALRETIWKLSVYGVLLFILCLCQIGCIVLAFMHNEQRDHLVRAGMRKSLPHQKKDQLAVWDRMQSAWKCCGLDGPKDYETLNMTLPKSCCKSSIKGGCTKKQAFAKGCYNDLVYFLNNYANVFGGVGGLIAVGELIGVLFSFWLVVAICRENKERKRTSSTVSPRRRYRYRQRMGKT